MTLFFFDKTFIQLQISKIKTGGWSVLGRKILILIKLLAEMVFKKIISIIENLVAIPFFIFIRFLSPFLLIRLGEIETRIIGHYSQSIEIYLCEQSLGINKCNKKHFDIWFTNKRVANKFLLYKWKKYLAVFPRFFIEPLFYLCRRLPGGKNHLVPYRSWRDSQLWQNVDIHDTLPRIESHISFSKEEQDYAFEIFETIGIYRSDTIVCFNARDPSFHEKTTIFGPRDSHISDQVLAMEDMVDIGYKCVRMGSIALESLDHASPNIIDYAHSGKRSEMLDLFILSYCRFMVSTSTGIDAIPAIFRRPMVFVNVSDIASMFIYNVINLPLFIPKKIFSIKENRLLTFSEIFALKVDEFAVRQQYENLGLKWIDNSKEEIRAVVREMECRMSGKWIETKEDIDLQKRFKTIFMSVERPRPLSSRVGANFLRENRQLLIF